MTGARIFTRQIFILLIIAFFGVNAALAGAGEKPFQPSDDIMGDVDAVLARAKAEDKLAMIVMGANWCHDSMGLFDHFKDPVLTATLENNYEMIFVDVGYLEHGKEVIQRFGQPVIYGTPTVLIVDPDTEELLNRESMHRLRESASMDIDEARQYFANTAANAAIEIDLTPSDPKLLALYKEIEAFEEAQAARIYNGFAVLSPLMREDEETGKRPQNYLAYWHELADLRYTITGDLIALRAEARERVAAGETNITLDFPEYEKFSWE